MKQSYILFILSLLFAACSDDMVVQPEAAVGRVVKFETMVVDNVKSRGDVVEVTDSRITGDFKAGDAFGLFVIDADDNFVTLIDGKPAKNLKLTTPDGVAWNLQSELTEIVHKLGYKYIAYFPYSATLDDCASQADIQAKLTAPAIDQTTVPATDWLFTTPTTPQTNAVTTLRFQHRYAKIDVYNAYTQEHNATWPTDFNFNKSVDENGVEHYSYLLDSSTPQIWHVGGTYTIGNYLTGMKELTYQAPDVVLQNGHHAIVYTYGMDERCAVDLGFPSGILWSPINLGPKPTPIPTMPKSRRHPDVWAKGWHGANFWKKTTTLTPHTSTTIMPKTARRSYPPTFQGLYTMPHANIGAAIGHCQPPTTSKSLSTTQRL